MALAMQVQPYLFFEGRCEEAIGFYRRVLGAEVTMLMRYKDSPDPGMVLPGAEDRVMHASFRIGEATVLASDGRCEGRPTFQGFSLSLTVPDEIEAERLFASLGDGGQVQMPLTRTFFSPRFGMVADRFGVSWMIYVAPSGARSEALAGQFEAKVQEAPSGGGMIKRLRGATIWSEDLNHLLPFYRDLLGLPVAIQIPGFVVLGELGAATLALGTHSEVRGRNADPARHMVGLETNHVDAEWKRLTAAGVEFVEKPTDYGQLRIATLRDPEGNLVQLLQPIGR